MTEGGTATDSARQPGRRRAEKPSRRLSAGNLGKPPLPRISLQSRFWRFVFAGAGVLLLLGWFTWYATTPDELPTSDKTISAPGVAGTPLYVGMFGAPDGFDRTLRISGVKVHATTSADLTITPLLCRRGTVGVTTGPEQFCSELIDPAGQRMVGGDSLVLKFEAAEPVIAVVDQLRVAYREDVRWDTQPAGVEQAIVTFSARPDVADDATSE
ncbi:hypothetical protein BJ993_000234 [Nocardioides aromaticivorans]|uniref:Uncharacterized protein n=1 Tax=Nocardioides aromaticivorans TaxID=200618 RepID=A0A7Z0CJL3_9ACTN|nr:hypothetical protein [Nocardioides aromaticivorans]NYI43154.1 hypothetical protein [Nocardioides aromaticivorans]